MKIAKPMHLFQTAVRRTLLSVILLVITSFHSFSTKSQDIPAVAVGNQTFNTNNAIYTHAEGIVGTPFSILAAPEVPTYTTFNVSRDNFVPDCSGAVGPTSVVTMINRRFQVHTKSGVQATNISLYQFWTKSTNTGSFNDVYDPVIVWDPEVRRFFATAANDARTTNAGIFIGVSLSEDPLGSWNLRRVLADPTEQLSWGDMPHIGFNDRFLVISANMLQNSSGNGGVTDVSRLWIIDKTNLLAGNFSQPSLITSGQKSLYPTANYDIGSTNLMFMANLHGNLENKGHIAIGYLAGTPPAPTLHLVGTNYIRVNDRTWLSSLELDLNPPVLNFAPQAGTNYLINILDARMHSVTYKNGYLYGIHSIFVPANNPTRSILQYFRVGHGQTNVWTIDDGSSFYGYPNLAVNAFGDLLIGYAKFRTNTYPSAAFQVKYYYEERFAAEQIFAPGTNYYVYHDNLGRNRWGDYTTSVVDGGNSRTFWTFGEFATNFADTTITASGRHGLTWAKIELFSQTNDFFVNSVTINGAAGTNGSIRMERLTTERNEPNHFGGGFVSMWYSWTPSSSGEVTFLTTAPSTAISVYTGSTIGGLTLVAESTQQRQSEGLLTKCTFNATGGVTYRIALLSPEDMTSRYISDLSWDQSTAPLFIRHPFPNYNEVVDGYPFTLTGYAIGNPSPTYQWKLNGANLAGATSTNYTISSMTSNQAGTYTVVASNTNGTATSDGSQVVYFSEGAQPLGAGYWTNNIFNFPLDHVVGYDYIVYGSTNLVDWVPIETNTVPFTFTDYDATNYLYRFYRSKFIP